MTRPSQRYTQRWQDAGPAGRHIIGPRFTKKATTPFEVKRQDILLRDLWKCHQCGGYGKLIDLSCDKCICRRCFDN